jgi:hypothetical protein
MPRQLLELRLLNNIDSIGFRCLSQGLVTPYIKIGPAYAEPSYGLRPNQLHIVITYAAGISISGRNATI